jgi:hypothetical protein
MIRLPDCDVVFLSYDEPNADANYASLVELIPRAKRVHGVKGFDAAHRRAAEVATSPHVITVDADNVLIDPGFLEGTFEVAPRDTASVFSFSARNAVNGLEYGFGGMKIWPRSVLGTLRTHERAARREAAVDFCWTVPYFQVNRVLSRVEAAASPFQAFRGGFREGVKFNLADGRLAHEVWPDLPRGSALRRHLGKAVFERLRVWCSVGRDVENGDWAIFGARLGCAMTALEGFEHTRVADYDWFAMFWADHVQTRWNDPAAREAEAARLLEKLNDELDLELADLDAAASAFFKSLYRGLRSFGQMSVA